MTTSSDTDGLVERLRVYRTITRGGHPSICDDSADTIEAQAARIAVLEGALEREWQPMDTAPMGGTPLLLFARCKTATAPVVLIGWHNPEKGWIESSFTAPVGIVPLAWQPRPAFPVEGSDLG